jgi:hypothetical protein
MPYHVENNEKKDVKINRRLLFWLLVIGIFLLIIAIWILFFSETVFNFAKYKYKSTKSDFDPYLYQAKDYYNQLKDEFQKGLKIIEDLSTSTLIENQSTSTP